MTIRFDEAWDEASRVASEWADHDRILVRDLAGRISIIVDDRSRSLPEDAKTQIARTLAEAVGRFSSPTPVLLASELFEPEAVFESIDLLEVSSASDDRGRLMIADRGAVGAEWGLPANDPPPSRIALYGFKGGVGRSTATFMLAQHLASSGSCVLVVDLDLESPGVGELLQREEHLPDFGLVDHVVEAAVGNEADLDLVARSQVVQPSGNGEVWVAPAGGRPREGYDYLAKLNRVYVDLPADDPSGMRLGFSERVERAIQACEQEVTRQSRPPDVVLLDSRAGIHDIAAVAIKRLSGLSLLFAMNNPQTWAGYGALFRQWGRNPELAQTMRDRLRMVAAFVPPDQDAYLLKFRDRAQACFAETLYDNASGDDPDAYNPGPADDTAPHSPLPVFFVGELVSLDQTARPGWHNSTVVQAAYEQFLHGAEQLILGDAS